MTRWSESRRPVTSRTGVALVGLLIAATSCASDSSDDAATGAVCGLIDRTLVTDTLTGDMRFNDIGDLSSADARAEGATCQLVNGKRTFLTATVTDTRDETQAAEQRSRLEGERSSLESSADCVDLEAVDTTLGYGSACVTRAGEVDLAVLTGHRLIRLIAKSTIKDVTIETATRIARSIDEAANG